MNGRCLPWLVTSIMVFAAVPADAQSGNRGQPAARPQSSAQTPTAESQGDNYSAGKTAAQLFASDCSVCHKNAQALAKTTAGRSGLEGFLRKHYTTSQETAALLAEFLNSGADARAGKLTVNDVNKSGFSSVFPSIFEPSRPLSERPAATDEKPRRATKPSDGGKPSGEKKKPAIEGSKPSDGQSTDTGKPKASSEAKDKGDSADKPKQTAGKPKKSPGGTAARQDGGAKSSAGGADNPPPIAAPEKTD
ncbi:MAG: hypothetical protein HY659_06240 [Rhizobiales bacterium]|nr:hypothetical protein [Hyphomicrobiales bacterium]